MKPLAHQGRCRDATGTSWDNNHPETQREADAETRAARYRDLLERERATVERLRDASAVLNAAVTLTALHLETDDWQPEHWDQAEAAARLLAPLLLGAAALGEAP